MMKDLSNRIQSLTAEKRRLLEQKLHKNIDDVSTAHFVSIPVIGEKAYYSLSSAQKRLFLLHQFEGVGVSYNLPVVMTIDGPLDPSQLEHAFRQLVGRHEAFRTFFELVGGEPVQRIASSVPFEVQVREVKEEELESSINSFIRPFDLGEAPLLRVELLKLRDDRHLLLYDTHHIISDGTSTRILIEEFIRLYEEKNLPKLRIQYKDFSAWQTDLFTTGGFRKQETYWLSRFSGELPILNLATDFPRPAIQSFEGRSISFAVGQELTGRLNRFAGETGATLFMILLATFNVLLARYTGQEDIVIGSPVAGRSHADLEGIIGMFVNTLALRNFPDGAKQFDQFLGEVREDTLKALENQDYQFEMLVEKLRVPRDMSRNPIFNVMFGFQNTGFKPIKTEQLRFIPYDLELRTAKFDLTLNVFEETDDIVLVMEYCVRLFREETIRQMAGHFLRILQQVLETPSLKLAEIDLLAEEERKRILLDFNDTTTEFPKTKTLCELFEEQVKIAPGRVALVFEEQQLTYTGLNQRCNQLAGVLRRKGLRRGQCVGLLTERSVAMIVGIFGILKAGGVYVPLDPEFPAERLSYMLTDCDVKLLLTQGGLGERLLFPGELIDLDDETCFTGECANPAKVSASDDPAYVMYTSGSTGKPKGTYITHSNISRVVKNTNYLEITDQDVLLQLSNYAFDGSIFDIFGALLNGAGLVLIGKDTVLNMAGLSRVIAEKRVSMFFVTTALFNLLVDLQINCLQSVRKILFGGERVSLSHVEKAFRALGPNRLIHVYGPTESTVFATYFSIDTIDSALGTIPIGRPLANTRVYILDRYGDPTPVGVPGELCVAGDGLALGYLNRPDLTAEKFVPDPFGGVGADPVGSNRVGANHDSPLRVARLYRTGDMARWAPDGNIEFIGRMDHQVKVRGHRIELGEIEGKLKSQPSVKEAVVTVKEDLSGGKYLCAFFVPEGEPVIPQLRGDLAQELPEYMIPAYFIPVEKMPLTPNGKIDLRALPEPSGKPETGTVYVPPRNETEEKLALIWQEVLQVERVGVNDEFFLLGGDSLKALKIATEATEQGLNLTVTEIFKHKTIGRIMEHRDKEGIEPKADAPEIIKVENKWVSDKMYEIDTTDRKELKIVIQRDVTVYLHRALPLCIVLADPRLLPWYYEHYVNIFSHTNREGFLTLEYLEVYGPYQDVLGTVSLGAKMMEKESDIIGFIIEQIDQGYYLTVSVDEYYLPGKQKYQTTHYIHHALVYGYDHTAAQVKVVGFDAAGIFNSLTFDYDTFREAYQQGKAYYQESAPWTLTTAVQLFFSNGFSTPYPFQLYRFLQRLEEYLTSASDDAMMYYWNYNPEQVTYGFQVYDLVINHLQNMAQGQFTMDYRVIHLLYEHKRGLAQRFSYIMNRYETDMHFKELFNRFLHLVDALNEIRLKFFDLQYGIVVKDGAIANGVELGVALVQILNAITTVKSMEWDLLHEIHRNLRQVKTSR